MAHAATGEKSLQMRGHGGRLRPSKHEDRRMKIVDIKAFPTSFPLPPNSGPRLGIGQAVKRDAVMVKVITEDGIVGWG